MPTIHQRVIPTNLQTHLDEPGTTLCFLVKITCKDGSIFGITSLDQDVTYDDSSGDGPITYSAAIGQDQSALDTTSDLEVDNSEAIILLSDAAPFTAQAIETGALDYAEYIIYRVNWQDLSLGHVIVQAGTTGAVKVQDDIAGLIELRGLPQKLKQNFVEQYSLTCRARFGGGSYADGRFPCGFDASTLWINRTVDTVDSTEPDRIFDVNTTPVVNGPNGALSFAPGLVEWLTGDNAGLTIEVEEVVGSTVSLRFGTPFDIQATDTLRMRPDCDKSWITCRDSYNNHLNFRGEPFIPITDEGGNQTPGTPVTGSLFRISPMIIEE